MTRPPRQTGPVDRMAGQLVRPVPPLLGRVCGAVVAALGVSWFAVGVAPLVVGVRADATPAFYVAMVVVFVVPGLLLTTMGTRLARGRSRHRDSLLSRTSWTALGLLFGCMVVAFALLGPWTGELVKAELSAAFLALACFGIAMRPRTDRG